MISQGFLRHHTMSRYDNQTTNGAIELVMICVGLGIVYAPNVIFSWSKLGAWEQNWTSITILVQGVIAAQRLTLLLFGKFSDRVFEFFRTLISVFLSSSFKFRESSFSILNDILSTCFLARLPISMAGFSKIKINELSVILELHFACVF